MKKITVLFSVLLFLIIRTLNAQNRYDYLIFPDTTKRIIIVSAKDSIGKTSLLSGVTKEINEEFNKKILRELNFSYHQSIIRLNQCSRNISGNTKGPNVLYLSNNEGGFPRHGIAIQEDNNFIEYPYLNYVDLVVWDEMFKDGALSIYSHEAGHVMMNNIWHNFPAQISRKQHVSMGVTDYYKAFIEGWGIHFQRLAYENVPLYQTDFKKTNDYYEISKLWHSNIDESLRIQAVLNNGYIFQKLLPQNISLDTLSQEDIILSEHTSPIFDFTRLKNAQQMLSCEGVIATIFYKINSDSILQTCYQNNKFYENFLLSHIPAGVEPHNIFTPFENVILKSFWVWNQIQNMDFQRNQILIEFIKEWCNSFPEDKDEIIKLFLTVTIGKTVKNEPGEIFEKMSWSGNIGNYYQFKKIRQVYIQTMNVLKKEVVADPTYLGKNIGPELWIENPLVMVRVTLWDDRVKEPLLININTAAVFEIASFEGFDLVKAEKLIKKRDELGYFNSFEEAVKYGFVFK